MFAFFINTDRFKSTSKICFIYSNKNLHVLTLQTNLYLIPAEIFSPSTTLSGLTACLHSTCTHVDPLIRLRRALSQTRNLLSLRSFCSSLMSSLKWNRILWKHHIIYILLYLHLQICLLTQTYIIAKRSILYELFHDVTMLMKRFAYLKCI